MFWGWGSGGGVWGLGCGVIIEFSYDWRWGFECTLVLGLDSFVRSTVAVHSGEEAETWSGDTVDVASFFGSTNAVSG